MLDDFDAAPDIAARVFEGFAVVFGDDAGEAVVILLQQPLEFEHHARAGGRRGVAPCGESALGAGDGAVDFGGRGARREGERFLVAGHKTGILRRERLAASLPSMSNGMDDGIGVSSERRKRRIIKHLSPPSARATARKNPPAATARGNPRAVDSPARVL